MAEKLNSEFIDAIHTDESQRMITERKYDCWETLPINAGCITLKREYEANENDVKRSLAELERDGLIKSIEASNKYVRVAYNIPLVDIKIPDAFPLGYQVTMDKIVEYAEFFEKLNAAPEILQKRVQEFVDKGANLLILAIKEIKELDREAPFPEVTENKIDLDYIGRRKTLKLAELFPEVAESKPSVLIKHVKNLVDLYLDQHESKEYQEIKEFLEQEVYDGYESDTSLTPCPAIYHDEIVDSRFESKYGDWVVPADVVMGNIATTQIQGDIDASASCNLYRKLQSRLYEFKSQVSTNEPLYAPPNVENLFIIHLPVITKDIDEAEKDLKLSHDNSSIVLVLCTDPTRLNPEVIHETFNTIRGENGWILAVVDPNTNELRRVVAKPKDQWKISEKKPRINIPLSLG